MSTGNRCINHACSGIYEFVAVQDSTGKTVFLYSLEEARLKEGLEPAILLYRCSRCNHLQSKVNEAFNRAVKKAYTIYHTKSTIPEMRELSIF